MPESTGGLPFTPAGSFNLPMIPLMGKDTKAHRSCKSLRISQIVSGREKNLNLHQRVVSELKKQTGKFTGTYFGYNNHRRESFKTDLNLVIN